MSEFTVGIVLFEGAEELDWAGPWEVFTMAAMGRDDLAVVTIAQTAEPVRCAKGLRVLPDHSFEDCPKLDLVLVPGGQGSRSEAKNEIFLQWLGEVAPQCQWVTSVCTGSLLLHAAGLVAGKRITTHWAYVPTLRELADEAEVLEKVRYVCDGNLVTAAGVSAGIDMSLWLVGQIFCVERARETQRFMEYDPEPPYGAEV
jgi:transcriptional regulator GlxA family with amidase domain